MSKAIAVALLAVGVILILFGFTEAESFASDVSRFFTGTPTDRSIWLMIVGVVLAIVGLFGVLGGKKSL